MSLDIGFVNILRYPRELERVMNPSALLSQNDITDK
jgi:hypothetical protein